MHGCIVLSIYIHYFKQHYDMRWRLPSHQIGSVTHWVGLTQRSIYIGNTKIDGQVDSWNATEHEVETLSIFLENNIRSSNRYKKSDSLDLRLVHIVFPLGLSSCRTCRSCVREVPRRCSRLSPMSCTWTQHSCWIDENWAGGTSMIMWV